ncbi:ParB/RepB/Spo0J family partition protein [Agrobacterium sp. LAD9]|uniref:ParB/RepB/Spo0J family partition protein n=1 Tax=Agrobacterium sp. LAD9 TaxID=2055153 RepID=UPI001864B16C|nr:ParB/RepB/Spo0J family partition protein [Agrobacterium sp. LAD9]
MNKLSIDPKNVHAGKVYSKQGIETLADSIRQDGYRLLQDPIVRKAEKKGHYYVIAGGRRLTALNLLAELGEIDKSYAIQCKERSGEDALEVSLVENIEREAMQPVDQLHAFRRMVEDGKQPADIAARFGVSEVTVRRRLALVKVAPALLDLYSKGEMNLSQLEAFTLTDDHERQVDIWKNLSYWTKDATAIRDAIRSSGVRPTDKRMKFLGGLTAYEAAGGAVRRDLFDDETNGFATDVPLVEKLVADKLLAEAENIHRAGWAWVECSNGYPSDTSGMRRIYPEDVALSDEAKAELDRLTAEHEELANLFEAGDATDADDARVEEIRGCIEELTNLPPVYRPEDVAISGCYVFLDHYGNLKVEAGFIRPESDPIVTEVGSEDETRGRSATNTVTADQKPTGFNPSAALVLELSAQKTAAIRAAMANNSHVALVAVVHSLLLNGSSLYRTEESCLDIRLASERLGGNIKDAAECKGIVEFDALSELYGDHIPGSPSDLWHWLLEKPQDELLSLLAYAAAKSVNALHLAHYARSKERAHADQLATALNMDMREWFVPTAANYFSRVSKTGIEEALAEAKGADFAAGVSGMKKADAAAYAERNIAGTGWLPPQLRIVTDASQKIENDHQFDNFEEYGEPHGSALAEAAE